MDSQTLHVSIAGVRGDFKLSIPLGQVEAFRAAEESTRGDYARIVREHPEWKRKPKEAVNG